MAALLSRRVFGSRLSLLPLFSAQLLNLQGRAAAQTESLESPAETGMADFSDAWKLLEGDEVTVVAAAPDLEQGYAEDYSAVIFSSAEDISAEFRRRCGSDFNTWFNASVANRGEWAGKEIRGNQSDFNSFWDQFLSKNKKSLLEFLAYSAVFVNEVSGLLANKSEVFGTNDHPGVSYLFDEIDMNYVDSKRKWRKASYNKSPNRTAGSLFRDEYFNRLNGALPMSEHLRNTSDDVWEGKHYPLDKFSAAANYSEIGYILEADFFKFRGRGLIQTTWRSNYKQIVSFIKSYTGAEGVVSEYARKWKDLDEDVVCTMSSNADWDRLFGDPAKIVLCKAIAIHAHQGGYVPLSKDVDGINGTGGGSLIYFGNSIGGKTYGQRLKARVRQICLALGR